MLNLRKLLQTVLYSHIENVHKKPGIINVNNAVGRLVSVSGTGTASGIHNIYTVLAGKITLMGMSENCGAAVVVPRHRTQGLSAVFHHIPMTVGAKDTLAGGFDDYVLRNALVPVAVSDHIPEIKLWILLPDLGNFSFAVPQMYKYIRFGIGSDYFFHRISCTMRIGYNNNSHNNPILSYYVIGSVYNYYNICCKRKKEDLQNFMDKFF